MESLPREKRLDSDGNQLSESELYNNTVESIDPSQLAYSDDEKKEIYLLANSMQLEILRQGPLRQTP